MRVLLKPAVLALSAFFFISLLKGQQSPEVNSPPETASAGGGLTLLECLEMAVRTNPELQQASTGFTDAEGRVLQLRALLYPQIQAQVVSTPPTVYAQVEQVLYSRAVDPSLKLSRLAEEEARINYQQALTGVLYKTRQAFFVALAREQEARLLERYLDFSQAMIPRATQLFEAGKIQKSEITRLEVKTNLARQKMLHARSLRHQALLGLEKILGQKLPENSRLKGSLGEESLPELNVAKLTEEAFLNRADYQALKNGKLIRTQQVVLSTHALYPRISAGSRPVIQPSGLGFSKDYDLNRNDNEPNLEREAGNTQIPLSLYLTWTFFDGGHSAGQKQSEESRLTSQKEALEALGRAIPNEIREAVSTLNTAQLTLETLLMSSDPEKLRQTYELDYQAGKIRLLDQSLMEDSILSQEEKILEARLHFSLSAAALDRSLGRVVQFR